MAADHPIVARIFAKLSKGEGEPFVLSREALAEIQTELLAAAGAELVVAARAVVDVAALLVLEGAPKAAVSVLEMSAAALPQLERWNKEHARAVAEAIEGVAKSAGAAQLLGDLKSAAVVPPLQEVAADFSEAIARLEPLRPQGKPGTAVAAQHELAADANDKAKRGVSLAQGLRNKEAVVVFREALAENGDTLDVWCNMAEILVTERRWTEAIVALEKCVQLDPDAARPHGVRARALVVKALKSLKAV